MTQPVKIRFAQPSDLGSLYDVMESVAAEGRWIGTELPFDREARRKHAQKMMADGTGAFLLAEIDGQLVGTLGLEQVVPGLFDIGMMLLAEWRGRGIGSVLMEECLDYARDKNAYKLTLQVWPHNEPAIKLYEKFGFEREGYLRKQWRRKNGELWDAIVMGLLLTED